MKVDEVAAELEVSNSYAYKLIRELNKELKAAGCIVINGRIDRKFFHEHLYAILKITVPRPVILHKPFADDGILRNDTLFSSLPIDHEITLPDLRGLHINDFADTQACVEQHHKHKTISDTQIRTPRS